MSLTTTSLINRWQPTKGRLKRTGATHPLALRMHRSLSWLQAADRQESARDDDAALIFRWIAFNALYGVWNESAREPEADVFSWKRFLKQVLAKDCAGCLQACLATNQSRVYQAFQNKFLNQYFWRTLHQNRSFSVTRNRFRAEQFYRDGNWQLLLEELLECIYLLRCQVVHGAATHCSRLNRNAISLCSELMDHLLKAILTVVIDHGLTMSWDRVCYPPVEPGEAHRPLRRHPPR